MKQRTVKVLLEYNPSTGFVVGRVRERSWGAMSFSVSPRKHPALAPPPGKVALRDVPVAYVKDLVRRGDAAASWERSRTGVWRPLIAHAARELEEQARKMGIR